MGSVHSVLPEIFPFLYSSQIAELKKEVEQLKAQLKRSKDFLYHLRNARDALKKTQDGRKNVVVVMGSQGSGKTTLNHYLFEVEGEAPIDDDNHGTKDLSLAHSGVLDADVVDTIGKTPNAQGMMRVLACVYNRGWNPVAVIVVHTGRAGFYEVVASHLCASKINLIDFSPKVFWRMVNESDFEVDAALEATIFCPKDMKALPHIHALGFPKDGGKVKFAKSHITDGNISYAPCQLTADLLNMIDNLKWEVDPPSGDLDTGTILSYYMVECISKRARFEGSDLDFIDAE
ncbi:expressed unknown protein [Seminavis robusta]|uniref:Uncharacterized protein n=1 Tax=Seminavis robusta TaxID=568900 RepID=A0A9N8F2T6_9STRA|nr:expressed unknown protein [Seminavis robusta]|eukprot:Sro3765_g350920.1 n/a (289) ;mRNA; r:2720-3586